MIGIIPVVVMGGVVKKFSDGFFGEPQTKSKSKKKSAANTGMKKMNLGSPRYPSSKYSPF